LLGGHSWLISALVLAHMIAGEACFYLLLLRSFRFQGSENWIDKELNLI